MANLKTDATTRDGSSLGTYYVSPDGSDSNPGTEAQPFRTIEKARTVTRAVIAGGMSSDITVFIRGGKYFLSSTLSFNEYDSGRDGYKVIYKNYPQEGPIIIGGQKITNWEHDSGGVYKAYLGDWRFYTLMENGVLSTMARTPNQGYLRVETAGSHDYWDCKFTYKAGDLPEGFDYADAQIYIKMGPSDYEWWTENLPISHIGWENHSITVEKYVWWHPIEQNDRYYVRGAKEFLDQPGEFYLDESAGYLYYWPRKTPIEAQEIIAPKMKRMIELVGSSSTSLVQNIRFEGLTLMLTDFVKGHDYSYSYTGKKEKSGVDHGLIYMENAANNVIKFCKIQNAKGNGILLYGYAQQNTIYGNLIENIGKYGVLLASNVPEGDIRYINKNNIISNNLLRNGYAEYADGSKFWISRGQDKKAIGLHASGGNEITHNEVARWPSMGIGGGGVPASVLIREHDEITWENCWDCLHTRDNYIGFNDISHCMEDANDGGGIYFFGGGKNNIIDNNRVHDITSGHPTTKLALGIYLDNSASYWTVKNNIIYGVGGDRAHPAVIKGSYNTFTNNIIVDNMAVSPHREESLLKPADLQLFLEDWAASRYPEAIYGHHTTTRNIFYRQDGYYIYSFDSWQDIYESTNVDEMDYNLFCHPGGVHHVYVHAPDGSLGDITLGQWRALHNNKYDQHSVIADPMFADGANHDYALQQGSPALALGFENIDQQNIGLKSDFPWDTNNDPLPMPTFEDVPPSHWAYAHIEALAQAGITGGCSADPPGYCPDDPVTRAQMAVFIAKALGEEPVADPTGIFNDIPPSHWAAGYIERFSQLGITAGCGEGKFCPEENVTRAQMAVFLDKALGLEPYNNPTPTFEDVPPDHWAYGYIERFYQQAITAGCGEGNYCPEDPVTRAQMAVFIVKGFNIPL